MPEVISAPPAYSVQENTAYAVAAIQAGQDKEEFLHDALVGRGMTPTEAQTLLARIRSYQQKPEAMHRMVYRKRARINFLVGACGALMGLALSAAPAEVINAPYLTDLLAPALILLGGVQWLAGLFGYLRYQ